ncbi:MAG: HdeA/HdeB family chaperone [Mangrovicoccus sp.]
MHKQILLPLLLALSCATHMAQAADSKGLFAVDGMGNMTCARFAELPSDSRDFWGAIGWMEGYITGFNQLRSDTYDVTPWQTTEVLASALRAGCADHPEVKLVAALNAMIKQLAPDRLTDATPIRRLDDGTNAVFVYETVLAHMRDKLHDQGYLAANTALDDQALFMALGSYQKDQGLAVTHLPDLPTVARILRP